MQIAPLVGRETIMNLLSMQHVNMIALLWYTFCLESPVGRVSQSTPTTTAGPNSSQSYTSVTYAALTIPYILLQMSLIP